ncbi:hypothetical protein [Marisediminicola sp. LYQ134]|uniref:hypothetical protein n=1 Tax=Marisediminicola sp. LYQ134 TaxID=3391061 RepID=UPI003982EDA6
MTEMRILTVRQPWAWAIIHAGKDVENRTRNIAGDYRGHVAIHVSRTNDDTVTEYEHPMSGLIFPPCPLGRDLHHNTYTCTWCDDTVFRRWIDQGHIIGVVTLVGSHRGLAPTHDRMTTVDSCFRPNKEFGPCSPWAESNTWHLELTNPRPLTVPLPYKGALGLRTLDDTTIATIKERLA